MTGNVILCHLIDPVNKPRGNLFDVRCEGDTTILTLKKMMKNELSHSLNELDASLLNIWRCTDQRIFSYNNPLLLEQEFKEAFSNGKMEKLDPRTKIGELNLTGELFAQLPVLEGGRRLDKRKHKDAEGEEVGELRASRRPKFSEVQDEDVAKARNAPNPSSAAKLNMYINEQEQRAILNGRPQKCSGLPVGLFHPIFDAFQAEIQSRKPFHASAETYSELRVLFKAFSGLYESETSRQSAIDGVLTTLLGASAINVVGKGVISDGAVIQPCGTSTAIVALREIMNEIGTGNNDPFIQGGLAYRKYWVEVQRDVLRYSCYCPTIILAIAGPWMCVLGGVYLEQTTTQPLTDYLWLGGDDFSRSRLSFAARFFGALKAAISSLSLYYQNLQLTLTLRSLSAPFPYVTEVPDFTTQPAGSSGTRRFEYLLRMDAGHSHNLLYQVKFSDGSLGVVKFTSRYHAQAHQILHAGQLAPALYYASTEDAAAPKYGGLYIIVMAFIAGNHASNALTKIQFERVERAMELLHSSNLVFGDLRPPNILVKDDSATIIDFDWCGTAGEDCYPPEINVSRELGWHPDVQPDSLMEKEHDLFMLNKLQICNT